MIYLDNAATTKVHPTVLQCMKENEEDNYFNATTLYKGGIEAAKKIEQASEVIKSKLNGKSGELLFTSGATEANKLIINQKIRRLSNHLITTSGDHNSVYLVSKQLQDQGYKVDYSPLGRSGLIDIDGTVNLINENTTLFVFSLINSDIGVLQDAKSLVQAIRQKSNTVHIHCDAVQAFCKFDFDVTDIGLDSVTISAHKINGPKGVGALWVKKGLPLPERHGTLNNAGIIGFAKATEIFSCPLVHTLHKHLIDNLPQECKINGINNNPYITNILLPVYGETILNALSKKEIYVGVGSACAVNSKSNRTLSAIKLSPDKQKQVLRVSLGMYNTLEDIKTFLNELSSVLNFIRFHDIMQ